MKEFKPIYMHSFEDNCDIMNEFSIDPDALDGCDVLLAYYHIGDYGCDSSAFVLYEKEGKLFEVNGGHCSCYGLGEPDYSGTPGTQWEPEEVSIEALEHRLEQGSLGSVGGYDGEGYAKQSREVVEHLKAKQGE